MPDFYTSDIMMFGTSWAPKGFLPCDGRPLLIESFPTLYSLIGVSFGGDEKKGFFNLPDLRGCVPVGPSKTDPWRSIGQRQGSATVKLGTENLLEHAHNYHDADLPIKMPLNVSSSPATQNAPSSTSMLATTVASNGLAVGLYNADRNPEEQLYPVESGDFNITVHPSGQGKEFSNMQPYTAIGFYICVDGTYPMRPD